jgi:hypothetical protein
MGPEAQFPGKVFVAFPQYETVVDKTFNQGSALADSLDCETVDQDHQRLPCHTPRILTLATNT